jgi:hypothetical protein
MGLCPFFDQPVVIGAGQLGKFQTLDRRNIVLERVT